MKLIRKLLFALPAMLVAGVFITNGAMAEPDAPRSCTTEQGFVIDVDVTIDQLLESTAFKYELSFVEGSQADGVNPDHAYIAMDCVPTCDELFAQCTGGGACAESGEACTTNQDCSDEEADNFCIGTCSESDLNCRTNEDCDGQIADDFCSVEPRFCSPTECISDTNPDANKVDTLGLTDCGAGDNFTGLGFLDKSRRTQRANDDGNVDFAYIEVSGTVTCDSGAVAIKDGKKLSSCEICAPLTAADPGAGAFANTQRIVTIGNCQFSRIFEQATGKLLWQQVLGKADEDGPPCEGIVVSKGQDGKLIAHGAPNNSQGLPSEGLPPLPFGEFQFNVDTGEETDPAQQPDFADFGLGLQDQRGGNEWTSGSGTCVTLSDGFGGTSLSCTCQKPLSPGELRYCR